MNLLIYNRERERVKLRIRFDMSGVIGKHLKLQKVNISW